MDFIFNVKKYRNKTYFSRKIILGILYTCQNNKIFLVDLY